MNSHKHHNKAKRRPYTNKHGFYHRCPPSTSHLCLFMSAAQTGSPRCVGVSRGLVDSHRPVFHRRRAESFSTLCCLSLNPVLSSDVHFQYSLVFPPSSHIPLLFSVLVMTPKCFSPLFPHHPSVRPSVCSSSELPTQSFVHPF